MMNSIFLPLIAGSGFVFHVFCTSNYPRVAHEGSHRAVVGAGRRVCRRHPNPASQPSERFLRGDAINHIPGTGYVRSNPLRTVMDGGRSLRGDGRGAAPCPKAAPSPARARGGSAGSNSWIGRVCRGTGGLPTLLVTLFFFPEQLETVDAPGHHRGHNLVLPRCASRRASPTRTGSHQNSSPLRTLGRGFNGGAKLPLLAPCKRTKPGPCWPGPFPSPHHHHYYFYYYYY